MKQLQKLESKPTRAGETTVDSFNGIRSGKQNYYIDLKDTDDGYTVAEAKKLVAAINKHIKRVEAAKLRGKF